MDLCWYSQIAEQLSIWGYGGLKDYFRDVPELAVFETAKSGSAFCLVKNAGTEIDTHVRCNEMWWDVMGW